MMTSFKGNSFKTFSIGILTAATISLSYGIYHAATYQPRYLDIELQNQILLFSVMLVNWVISQKNY